MAFTHRSIRLEDLEACALNLRESFAYDSARRKRLLALWRELVASESWITVAIEDRRLPTRQRLVGFGMSVFINDAFADKARKGLPLLSRAFLEDWEKGNRPYLLKKEVAAANGGAGLNLLVLHYGWDEKKLAPEDMPKVQLKQTERFIEQHAGYKVKDYLQEVHGAYLRDFVLRAGSVLRHGYGEKKWKAGLAGVAEKDWPFLTGFSPEEALAQAGTAASIFQAKALQARFHLAASEQEMLNLALLGKTDEELAKAMGLSQWTIKKRWQSVYLKVKKADSDLLVTEPAKVKTEKDRNRQRRRYLMEYLRSHPEELRPRTTKGKTHR